jgi:DeoR/GlpR family transcriptional regulator of sugar metabolism
MLQAERQAKILELLKQKGFIENSKLQEIFEVTPITIRRDIKKLSKQNLIKVVHGGAIYNAEFHPTTEPFYFTKLYLNIDKKEKISDLAIQLIDEGDSIILDSGTTSYQIALKIKNKNLSNITIVTNDIKIANELCGVDRLKIIVLGGELKNLHYSIYGPSAVKILNELKVDKLFLTTDAVSKEGGISNSNIEDVPVKQQMIKISKQVILVADSTKFGKDAFCNVCNWNKINLVITDEEISQSYLDFFEEMNIAYSIPSFSH